MNESSPVLDDAVYHRTHKGQWVVMADHLHLEALERRVLLLVNGITPLKALARVAGAPLADFEKTAALLLQQGLIEPV